MQVAELSQVMGSWICWFVGQLARFVVHNGSLAWNCAYDFRIGDLPRIMFAYVLPFVGCSDIIIGVSINGERSILMLVDVV